MSDTQKDSERPKTPKNVQMPYELLIDLFHLHISETGTAEQEEHVKAWIVAKIHALVAREQYTRYKDSSLTPEEREKARQEYVKRAGIHEDFTW